MLSLLLPSIAVSAAAVLSLTAVYAVRAGVFAPVAEPELAQGASDPTAITLPTSQAMVQTVLQPRPPEWQTATLHSLSEVEDLLDSLEAHGILSREVSVVNGTTFDVRWK